MQRLSFRPAILVISCLLLTLQGFAQSAWVPGEVLVLLKKDARISDVQRELLAVMPARMAIKEAKPLGKESRYHKIVVEGAGVPDKDFEKLIARMQGVEATSLNYRLKFYAEPNDAQYGTQWNMDDINVEAVWDFTTGGTMANGKRIGVGISDEAIQTDHPDLEDNIWPNSPAQTGASEHGTEVASVVGAVGNNALGIAGVNWDVEILSGTDLSDLSEVVEQFELAISLREQFNNTNGASGLMVVSMTASWGSDNGEACNGFSFPLFAEMADAGIILVASGPNEPISIESGTDFPANCALAEHLVVTSYGPSNETPYAFGPNTVHLLAPGVEIPVATTTNAFAVVDGNSFAIPTVAGAIALLYSIPCQGFAQLVMDDPVAARTMVKNAILNNTAPFPGGNTLTITGGKLDVHAAYQSLMAQCPACDTVTVQLNTSAGNAAQYTLVNGIGATLAQGTGDEFQICPGEGCFNATIVDGASQPLNGTYSVSSDGEVFQSGTIVNGELTFDFGQVTNGCTDPNANNYDAAATCDDGSCCSQNTVTIVLTAQETVANGTALIHVEAASGTLFNGPVTIAHDATSDMSYARTTVCAPSGCLTVLAQENDVPLGPNVFVYVPAGPIQDVAFPTGQSSTFAVGVQAIETCDGIDNNCDGVVDEDFIWYVDADGDGWGVASTEQIYCIAPGNGYSQQAGDCDDNDDTVNPGMQDACADADGLDNDCDGAIDNGGLQIWYLDADGDGFGSAATIACTPPAEHVANDGDCDDQDPAISPIATEICDGLDNNCDGVIDEGFTWYTDADGDGYGDDATAQNTCSPPLGAVQVGGDCDDNDPTRSSSATLYVVSDLSAVGGSANYVFTQGSAVITGEVVLQEDPEFEEATVGIVSECLVNGCFSITVSPNNVQLAEDAYVEFSTDPGNFEMFSISTGFFGSNGIADAELCDGLDNDCDGEVDEDFRWYTDADGDGFGDETTMQISCSPVPNAIQISGDCNDADPNLTTLGAPCNDGDPATNNDSVRNDCTCLGFLPGECPPGEVADCNGNCAPEEWIGDGFCDNGSFEHNGNAIFFDCLTYFNDGGDCDNPCVAEVCDGLDNDCDGQVDEGFLHFADNDEDGFGDPNSPVACQTPGSVGNNSDCDDTNAALFPGAPCSDGNACTNNDLLDANCQCIGGSPTVCDDGDPCTIDSCDPATGCVFIAAPAGTACDDNDPCTVNDVCSGSGVCAGTPVTTDTDGDGVLDCSDNCPNMPGVIGSACDDGNPATILTQINASCMCALVPGSTGTVEVGVEDEFTYFAPGAPLVAGARVVISDMITGVVYADGYSGADGVFTALNVPIGSHAITVSEPIHATHQGTFTLAPNTTLSLRIFISRVGPQDSDGDGFFTPNDCDDSDPAIHPGATETCDNVDNDCDGFIDEGIFLWYIDADADGFGDPSTPAPSCTPIFGYAQNNLDCDDTEQTVNPFTTEYCDGLDNDCNGIVDDVPDSDGDGLDDCADNCRYLPGQIGDPCPLSGDPLAPLGIINPACTCSVACSQNILIDLRTDLNSQEASFIIRDDVSGQVQCVGNGFFPGITTPIVSDCCLPEGCFKLEVYDSGGDGFVNGGYQVREAGPDGRRIIDNFGNFQAGSSSAMSDPSSFCLPIGTDGTIFSSCDKLDWVNNKFIVARANPLVSAQFGVTNTTSGYEFWFFDPNGTYSYRRFRSHAASDGFGSGATRACHFKVNGWINTATTPHLPANVLLNVRVRGRANGEELPFGPTCLFKIDAVRAACPLVHLQDDPSNPEDFSCGVIRQWGGSNSASNRIVANPPQPIPTVASNMVRYQFRFRIPGEGICLVRPPQTSARIHLNWNSGTLLECSKTYEVDVRVSLDGGTTWCFGPPTAVQSAACAEGEPWGRICNVTVQPCGTQVSSALLINDGDQNDMLIFPNPNNGRSMMFSFAGSINTTEATIEFMAMNGSIVVQRRVGLEEGVSNFSMDLDSGLSNGIYLARVQLGDRTFVQRVVVQE